MKRIWISIAQIGARYLPARIKTAFYKNPRIANFIRQRINPSVPDGITLIEVAGGGLAGFQIWLDLKSEKDYWLGTYELALQEALGELVQPGMIAYDIGANIGYITLLLAHLVGENGVVYAFEALPTNLERLETNVAQNQMDSRVNIVHSAVVERSGPVEFMVGPSGGMGKAVGSVGRTNIEYSNLITVPGVSMDEFVYEDKNPVPQLVKMDIEGGETLALPGMKHLILEAQPLLLLELHGPESAECAWIILREAGYRLCYMQRHYPPVPSLEGLDWKSYLVAFP